MLLDARLLFLKSLSVNHFCMVIIFHWKRKVGNHLTGQHFCLNECVCVCVCVTGSNYLPANRWKNFHPGGIVAFSPSDLSSINLLTVYTQQAVSASPSLFLSVIERKRSCHRIFLLTVRVHCAAPSATTLAFCLFIAQAHFGGADTRSSHCRRG